MRWLLIAAGVGVAIYAFHRVATYAASRGWVYYRNGPKRGYSLGLIEEVFQPSMEFALEEESSEAVKADIPRSGQGEAYSDGYRDRDGSR